MRIKLKEVEYFDNLGRLCVVQFWNWEEAMRFAFTVPILVQVREQS